jgi:hypothetical protein
MRDDSTPSYLKLIATIAVFTILGIPIAAFLWETLNRVMAGVFDPVRIGISIPLLLLFAGLLYVMGRTVRGLERERVS